MSMADFNQVKHKLNTSIGKRATRIKNLEKSTVLLCIQRRARLCRGLRTQCRDLIHDYQKLKHRSTGQEVLKPLYRKTTVQPNKTYI